MTATSFPNALVIVLISDCKKDPEMHQLGEPVKDNYLLRRNTYLAGKPMTTGKDFWSIIDLKFVPQIPWELGNML